MKKIIYIALCASVLAGCKDQYKDWAPAQVNPQNPVIEETVSVAITPAVSAPIDFATYTADSIQLFTTSDPALSKTPFTVDLSGDSAKCSTSLVAAGNGKIASEDLKAAVIAMYGRRGVERTLHVTVGQLEATKTTDGNVMVKYTADPFVMNVKLVMPLISSAYYYIGTATDGKMAADKQFTHSEADVYADPIFTFTFAGTGEEMWFVFTDKENIKDDWGNPKSWDEVYGYVGEETGTAGTFARRTELGKDETGKYIEHSFKVDGKAASYTFIIDMMEQTYEIKK